MRIECLPSNSLERYRYIKQFGKKKKKKKKKKRKKGKNDTQEGVIFQLWGWAWG